MKSISLQNDVFKLTIAKPGEVYQGPRFDWTGFITELTFKGHSFCVPEKYVKEDNSGGIGFCNEFGIDKPIGYEDAKVGEEFLKIGSGLVTKIADTPYNFFDIAPIRGLQVIEEQETDKTYKIVTQISDGNKYHVVLTKVIAIEGNLLTFHYSLENQGALKISTNEYNHNFIGIDQTTIGPNYVLTIPALQQLNSVVGDFQVDGQTITWDAKPEGDFYAIVELGHKNETYNWEVKQLSSKVGVRELSTFPVAKAAFWGSAHVVCPELFIDVEVEPGAHMSWQRRYEFFEVE